MPVIDASCYVAIVNAGEPSHDDARSWFRQAALSHQSLIAPSILVAEVAAALSRGTQDAALAHRGIARLMGSRLIQLKPVTPALAELAGNIAADHRVRGCDAIYLALAMQMNDVLVTLDRQQLERGSAVAMTMQPKT